MEIPPTLLVVGGAIVGFGLVLAILWLKPWDTPGWGSSWGYGSWGDGGWGDGGGFDGGGFGGD